MASDVHGMMEQELICIGEGVEIFRPVDVDVGLRDGGMVCCISLLKGYWHLSNSKRCIR